MSCEHAEIALHGYFDDELDAVRAAEFERHLEGCSECRAALEGLRSLRSGLRDSSLYQHASSQLRERVRQQIAPEPAVTHLSIPWRRFFAPAFAMAAMAIIAWVAFLVVQPRTAATRITAGLVDAHVRSLQPGHLYDVESTDQHTVKPWFDGKLAFVPPVSDYAAQGFPLVGGRLDAVDGNAIAALVYARRKHVINLFVWPARGDKITDTSGSQQGYSWILWRSGEMQYCLVSDVAATDLQELKKLIQR